MNKFFKGSISVLALATLLATSATAQVDDLEQGVGYLHELGNTPTGAVEKITSERFENYNMSSTEALVGQFAALNGLDIRGVRSTNSTDALILVDGMEQFIDDVDVVDIESIQILKDAAATASYGIRAANGIILITTKRGYQNDKPALTFKAKSGFLYNAELPEMTNAEQYNSVVQSLTGMQMNTTADIDWAEEMLKPIVNQVKVSAQVAGGTKIANYFVSAIYEQKGSMYNYDDNASAGNFSGSDNIRMRSNLDLKVSRNTTFSALMNANIYTTRTPEVTDATLLSRFYTTPASRYEKYTTYTNADGSTTDYYDGSSLYQLNPYASLVGRGYDHTYGRSFIAQGVLTHELDYLTEGLYVKGKIGYASDAYVLDAYEATYMSAGYNSAGEIATYGTTEYLDWASRSRGDYTWQTYNVTAGYDRDFTNSSLSVEASAQLDNYIMLSTTIPYNYFNAVGSAIYNYDKRYTAQLTVSYGGDNALIDSFLVMPTLGLAWNVSNESFWSKNDIVNSLKVRGSFGKTASDELGSASRFMYLNQFAFATSFYYTTTSSATGCTESQYAYDGTYESSWAGNIGVDVRLFNSLNISIDYFNETRSDIYTSYGDQLSESWGGVTPYVNYGKVHSQGVELVANYSKAFNKDLRLNASLVAGYSKNIIKQIYQLDEPYVSRIGNSTTQIYGFTADGLYQEDDFDSDGNLLSGMVTTYGPVQAGDIKYKDLNDDGVIDGYDKSGLYSNSNPIDLALNLDLQYKGFRFAAMFDSQLNSQTNLQSNIIYDALGSSYNNISTYAYLNSWTASNPTGTLPRLTIDESGNNNENTSLYVKNTNYVRLRTLFLGYTFPIKGTASIGVNVSGHNLFTIDSLPGNMNATNLDYAINGSAVTIGVDFNF